MITVLDDAGRIQVSGPARKAPAAAFRNIAGILYADGKGFFAEDVLAGFGGGVGMAVCLSFIAESTPKKYLSARVAAIAAGPGPSWTAGVRYYDTAPFYTLSQERLHGT